MNGGISMEIRLEMDEWIINNEYFITNGLENYEVYTCGTDENEAEEQFSGTFEECLTWIWNSL